MAATSIVLKLTSESPLLMHSDRFSDPLDPATQAHKELTAKKKKTDVDQREIMKSEWKGSLYHSEEAGVYIPGQNIYATLFSAAKLRKLGTTFKRGVFYPADEIPLEYDGPKDLDEMFADPAFRDVRGVKVTTSRIMRCRPRFLKWECTFSLEFENDVLNKKEIMAIAHDAGKYIGLCDYRPRFGKFHVEEL